MKIRRGQGAYMYTGIMLPMYLSTCVLNTSTCTYAWKSKSVNSLVSLQLPCLISSQTQSRHKKSSCVLFTISTVWSLPISSDSC